MDITDISPRPTPSPYPGPPPIPPVQTSSTPWTGFIDTNSIVGITKLVGKDYIKTVQKANNIGTGGGGGSNSGVNEIELSKNKQEDEIAQLLLMDIGGRELATLSRHDQINGINQEYSPIKNLADISLQYNPLTIAQNADNVTTYLTTFNFDISKYVPTQSELDLEYPLDEDIAKRTVVYFDKSTNSLNIHVKNIFTNEKVEIEFIIPEEVKDGTIYT